MRHGGRTWDARSGELEGVIVAIGDADSAEHAECLGKLKQRVTRKIFLPETGAALRIRTKISTTTRQR